MRHYQNLFHEKYLTALYMNNPELELLKKVTYISNMQSNCDTYIVSLCNAKDKMVLVIGSGFGTDVV